MLATTTAQPYSWSASQQELFPSTSELYAASDSVSCCTGNTLFSPTASVREGPTSVDRVLPSPTEDVAPMYIKRENYSESEDEQSPPGILFGGLCENSYSRECHTYGFNDGQDLPVCIPSSTSSISSSYCCEEALNVNQCAALQREFPPSFGTSDAVVPVSVAAGQPNDNLETCENMKVKLEHPVTPRQKSPKTPKKAKPLPVHAIQSSPLPPGIELPAILGGKLPPRTFKAKTKKHVYTERELKSRRKRGLPDDSDSESEERRQVRLPRRSLLTITTPQMSQFVSFMRTNLPLTPSQQDELSKQKRLVKNRESACRFRAKKVLTLIEYRDRVTELESDIVSLRMENERLRRELEEARSSPSNPSLSAATLPKAELQSA